MRDQKMQDRKMQDQKCRGEKCGNENEELENAGPVKCGTWNTNDEFHIYTVSQKKHPRRF